MMPPTHEELLPAPASPEIGHPVRSFVAVLLLIATILLALRLTGAVTPDLGLRLQPSVWMQTAEGSIVTVELHNRARLPVRVVAASWPARSTPPLDPSPATAVELPEQSTPGMVDLGQLRPAERFEIPAGGSITLAVRLPACELAMDALQLRVRTWVGLERTVEVAGTDRDLVPPGPPPADGSCP